MPDDFMVFVRSALNAVNAKLDNIVTLKSSMERKLADIDTRVTGQATTIAGLTESVQIKHGHASEGARHRTEIARGGKSRSAIFDDVDSQIGGKTYRQ